MPSLGRLGEKAITAGVNVVLPAAVKVAEKVNGLKDGPAGKAVGSVLEKGHELASPMIDPVMKKLGLGGDGSGAPKTTPEVQQAAADSASAPSTGAASPDRSPDAKSASASGTQSATKSSSAGNSSSRKSPAKKTSAKKTTRKPSGDVSRKAVPEPTQKADAVSHADIVTPGAPGEVDEMSLPIAGYSRLAANKIPARLEGLTNSELALLFKFERANKNRSTITEAIESRLVDLPMPTYDKMTSSAILDSLNGLTRGQLRTIREYEARTTNRLPVLDRIDELLALDV